MEDVLKRIQDYALEEIMGVRFGAYAKEIIQDRAIPDVRDGLKPVQRRILYAMYKAGNTWDKPHVKCAATVGDVLGKFHPHGDSSVYDAMVRMSQWWKQNEVLVDIHGNNGSMDGDSAAAYRYTEARLARISNELLCDLDKDTVEWAPNFDDRFLEPTVLPAKYPNLLVNGTNGISAGYATNIPPHNLGEIIDATIKRIESPNCHFETILDIVKGPDFPTGGIVEGKKGIIDAFKTGKGKVIVKSKVEFKKDKGKDQILITEIPFDVNKATLVNKIDSIRIDKKIEGISEVRDESDRDGLRIVVDLKSGANKDLILNYLYKNTELQITYSYNMVSIVNRRPMTLGLIDIIDAYIKHQTEVIRRRTNFDLKNALLRYEILEGLVKVMSILDEVIKIIRASKNKSDAKNNLVKEFAFTERQADAIVMLQLYKLTNTDVTLVLEEKEELAKKIDLLKRILASDEALKRVIVNELKQVKHNYAHPRKTKIVDEVTEIKIDVTKMIPKENVIVVVTNEGYVKRVSPKSYSTADGETTLKPGDYITGLFETTNLDTLLLFTNLGNYLYVPIHKIFEGKWKELGKHISNLIPLAENEYIINSFVLEDKNLTLVTKNGMVKQINMKDLIVNRYSKSLTAMKLKDNDELVNVSISKEDILIVTHNGYYLKYKCNEIPIIGPKASGVKGINLKEDYVVNGFSISNDYEYLNIITNHHTAKRIKLEDLVYLTRAKKGNMLLKKTKTVTYNVDYAFPTNSRDIILVKNDIDIKEIKNSDIAIMDITSNGGNIVSGEKYGLFQDLVCIKNKEDEKEENTFSKNDEQLSMDNFLDSFKL